MDAKQVEKYTKEFEPVLRLTDREYEVFVAIGEGKCVKDICRQFNISEKTVQAHAMHLRNRMGLPGFAEMRAKSARYVMFMEITGFKREQLKATEAPVKYRFKGSFGMN